ncbi:MAG: hypothetical protein Q8K66_13965 [Sediminibacterium sp.]|nr:hypothetical protein [Sediminibacterium sp.]
MILINSMLFAGMFCTISCGKNKVEDKLLTSLKPFVQGNYIKNADTIVYAVIPNQGCEGCISDAEGYVVEHALFDSDRVIFIFTQIQSLKVLKYKLGSKTSSLPNVKMDVTNSIFFPTTEKQIYPMFVYAIDNSIVKIDYQSPQSNGLINLSNFIKTKKIR